MRRKFRADEINKQILNENDEEESTSESEEYIDQEIEFNPSRLRTDAIPTEGIYEGQKVSRKEIEASEPESDESNEDIDDTYSESDMYIPEPDGSRNLEAELELLEKDEGAGLLDSLKKQQEADLKVARGTSALQNQYSALLLLRLKMQGALSAVNLLPSNVHTEESDITPFQAATEDQEVASMLAEISQSAIALQEKLHHLKLEIENTYEWEESEAAKRMIENISHWSQRIRLSSGMKKGVVINRPIDQQISAALSDKEILIQPTRHRERGDKIFGFETQPEVVNDVYNDSNWYKRLLSDVVGIQKKETKVVATKPKKQLLRSRQIHYDIIPELQNFMTSVIQPIPSYADALFNSLMK
ncbi:TRAUB-domain-containing protein [Histomonas meleagridis]|uniref:TRAUB-domain-containing protein n=1 Tax=Histomonas meleagridis TaxID=135588 RepID=UPI00355A427C|nr:TRAUB-domain-containing protein [Histomonas meleagridis]KAH0799983.1 TRAUB-domain-containing protein [Histomonas meleagridis]